MKKPSSTIEEEIGQPEVQHKEAATQNASDVWARELTRLVRAVRMMPPAYVKPDAKLGKNDAVDAEATCEAGIRPTMRFVAMKSAE